MNSIDGFVQDLFATKSIRCTDAEKAICAQLVSTSATLDPQLRRQLLTGLLSWQNDGEDVGDLEFTLPSLRPAEDDPFSCLLPSAGSPQVSPSFRAEEELFKTQADLEYMKSQRKALEKKLDHSERQVAQLMDDRRRQSIKEKQFQQQLKESEESVRRTKADCRQRIGVLQHQLKRVEATVEALKQRLAGSAAKDASSSTNSRNGCVGRPAIVRSKQICPPFATEYSQAASLYSSRMSLASEASTLLEEDDAANDNDDVVSIADSLNSVEPRRDDAAFSRRLSRTLRTLNRTHLDGFHRHSSLPSTTTYTQQLKNALNNTTDQKKREKEKADLHLAVANSQTAYRNELIFENHRLRQLVEEVRQLLDELVRDGGQDSNVLGRVEQVRDWLAEKLSSLTVDVAAEVGDNQMTESVTPVKLSSGEMDEIGLDGLSLPLMDVRKLRADASVFAFVTRNVGSFLEELKQACLSLDLQLEFSVDSYMFNLTFSGGDLSETIEELTKDKSSFETIPMKQILYYLLKLNMNENVLMFSLRSAHLDRLYALQGTPARESHCLCVQLHDVDVSPVGVDQIVQTVSINAEENTNNNDNNSELMTFLNSLSEEQGKDQLIVMPTGFCKSVLVSTGLLRPQLVDGNRSNWTPTSSQTRRNSLPVWARRFHSGMTPLVVPCRRR